MYKVISNPYNLNPEDFIVEASRFKNNKRSQIFLSKVLGRHLTTQPGNIDAVGYMLCCAARKYMPSEVVQALKDGKNMIYPPQLQGRDTVVIGFADASLGLSQAVASFVTDCHYLCTTHDSYVGVNECASFKEEHSFAPDHKIYGIDESLKNYTKAILVEDEMTTGKSMLEIIKELYRTSGIKQYKVLTIMDSRSEEQVERFEEIEERLGIRIEVTYLFRCKVEDNTGDAKNTLAPTPVTEEAVVNCLYSFPRIAVKTACGEIHSTIIHTGKFGLAESDILEIKQLASTAADRICKLLDTSVRKILGKSVRKILVIGHVDNIYATASVAAKLKDCGFNVGFKMSIRSPINIDGEIIKSAVSYESRGGTYYVYNSHEFSDYDLVIGLCDVDIIPQLCDNYVCFKM